ncbi:MAG: winged helix-turn-helix transcriptional regulator [Candidatus Lokiarchaeota archaeon]|nr:winged helix-turn-helix transcriptional regulator [Candidatus Lokiarchaeota archaeon]MBD3201848.1 winged helix-turn-helix transcriptional regulator [Candidatus Lokiarchaeota archaeon]
MKTDSGVKQINKKKHGAYYEQKILEYLMNNPSGLTKTDIAKGTGFSRNTIYKYISMLEDKDEIYKKKVGAYNLYFSKKQEFFPKRIALSYYKALIAGFKNHFPGNEEILKEIGKESSNFIDFDQSEKSKKQLKGIRGSPILKLFFEVLPSFYPSFDLLQPNIKISEPEIQNSGKKAIYRFTNSEFINDTEDFVYHFYLITGIIETQFSEIFNRKIKCNIEKVKISKDNESYVDISILVD